jgi:hypothetical protein
VIVRYSGSQQLATGGSISQANGYTIHTFSTTRDTTLTTTLDISGSTAASSSAVTYLATQLSSATTVVPFLVLRSPSNLDGSGKAGDHDIYIHPNGDIAEVRFPISSCTNFQASFANTASNGDGGVVTVLTDVDGQVYRQETPPGGQANLNAANAEDIPNTLYSADVSISSSATTLTIKVDPNSNNGWDWIYTYGPRVTCSSSGF